jgi:uncharacterized protein (UPF0264 family)
VAEAEAALAGGADWIDLKEPSRGALGAVDAAQAREVVDVVAGRTPVSAAAGELRDWASATAQKLLKVEGISYLKLGLAGCRDAPWREEWHSAGVQIEAAGKKLVPVVYADPIAASSPCPEDVLRVAKQASCEWLLVDTYDKNSGSVMAHMRVADLRLLVAALRMAGMGTVVAGRLDPVVIKALPLERIDMIGVRGAACEGGRSGEICRQRVAELKRLLVGTSCRAQ